LSDFSFIDDSINNALILWESAEIGKGSRDIRSKPIIYNKFII
jgi:hypothetical protein